MVRFRRMNLDNEIMSLYFYQSLAVKIFEGNPDSFILLIDKYLLGLQYFGSWF